MYKVRDSSGVEYGPLDLETLELWAVQNRINANSIIIDQSTGETKLAKTIPELQAIFHVPAAFPQRAVQVPIGAHSPIIAVVLSILLSGLGQVYNRQILKGVVFFLVNLCLCCGGFIISMGASCKIGGKEEFRHLASNYVLVKRHDHGGACGENILSHF